MAQSDCVSRQGDHNFKRNCQCLIQGRIIYSVRRLLPSSTCPHSPRIWTTSLPTLMPPQRCGVFSDLGALDVEALQLACLKGHLDVVDKLLSVGVDPNQVGGHGWTATMCAMHSQSAEIRERLGLPTDDEKRQPPSNIEILAPNRLSESDKSLMQLLSDDGLCVTYTGMSADPTPSLTSSLAISADMSANPKSKCKPPSRHHRRRSTRHRPRRPSDPSQRVSLLLRSHHSRRRPELVSTPLNANPILVALTVNYRIVVIGLSHPQSVGGC